MHGHLNVKKNVGVVASDELSVNSVKITSELKTAILQ